MTWLPWEPGNLGSFTTHFAPIQIARLAISRQSSGMVQRSIARGPILTGKLLLPVNNRLNFHQTHERAAEATCVGIPEGFGDIGQTLGAFEQPAGDVQASLREHLAVTCAHAAEMALQCARADLELSRRTVDSCVALSQRRDDDSADRLG